MVHESRQGERRGSLTADREKWRAYAEDEWMSHRDRKPAGTFSRGPVMTAKARCPRWTWQSPLITRVPQAIS
ncbi:hypothetical protein CU254_12730 [Amycolatopsis sp. AA4]|nr:hypothetical protein CU254_12730 [Amycolatopsis sp. AA4]